MTEPEPLPQPLLDAWRRAVGAAHVLATPAELDIAARCTFPGAPRPVAVVLPGTEEEAGDCLRAAQRYRVPLHPVSTGRNWGYGSACPPRPGTAVLKLSRMRRVRHYDGDLGLVTLEPGVTFGQLHAFLREHAPDRLAPATGAGPDTSVVGNVLQRGLGRGPYREMASRLRGLTALRSDGSRLTTAPGPGPDIRGLFVQGGPGAVTALTLALHPVPAVRQRIAFRISAPGAPAGLIDVARELLQRTGGPDGGVTADLLSLSRIRAQSAGSAHLADVLSGPWTGRVELWAGGPGDDPGAAAEPLQRLREQVLGRYSRYAARWDIGVPRTGPEPAPTDDGLLSAYRYRRSVPARRPLDPGRDGCGVLWFAPLLPMRGPVVAEVVAAVEATMRDAGFDPCLSLRLGPLDLHCVAGLFWDRNAPGADQRAVRCHARLTEVCARLGVHSYRPVLGLVPEQAVDPGARRFLDDIAAAVGWPPTTTP